MLTPPGVSQRVLNLEGMSGRRYRALINRLIGALESAAYLEIGIWAGSTLCSAIADNKVTAVGIDNWSKFGGPRERFFRTLRRFQGPDSRVTIIERDFHDVDFSVIGRFNVYLFDGPHGEEDQYDGVVIAQPALAKDFVLIVDDWNRPRVRRGTQRAIESLGLRVNYAVELRTTLDDNDTPVAHETSDWHNGYFLASLSKTQGVT
ncbi:MAG: class I SAM-dependent methyltransferase [Stellaceae bacterium]